MGSLEPYICKRGHVVEGDNLRVHNGKRACRECNRLRRRVPVDPEEGVECRVCGLLLRELPTHIVRIHGLTSAEYREQFPGAPLIGLMVRGIRRDLYQDQVDRDGDPLARYNSKQKECRRGHPLTGRNVLRRPNGRQCRTCYEEAQRAHDERTREEKRAYDRARYLRIREAKLAYSRARYAANREEINARRRATRQEGAG